MPYSRNCFFASIVFAIILNTSIQALGQYSRSWGTYYGGTRRDELHAIAVVGEDAVYAAGWTQSDGAGVISTPGAFQVNRGSTSTGSSGRDGRLVKFNGAGVRQWATYYGGNQEDRALAITADAQGNVYLAGRTGGDAFLAKFNANGTRLWGITYGGAGSDIATGVATDPQGNVIICGETISANNISTPDAHQPAQSGTAGSNVEAFVVKFNADGVRQWGTYYGGIGNDFATAVAADAQGNIIVCGYTNSGSAISTPGSHQEALAPATTTINDGFVVKFNSQGVRQWGTYYGGSQNDYAYAVSIDAHNNIYVAGNTQSISAMATPGSHQSSKGGNTLDSDAFLVKFNSAGVRQWATYYGGTGTDGTASLAVSSNGDIAMAGASTSAGVIATADGFQTSVVGNGLATDGYLVVFGSNGVRKYGSYYGGSFDDNSTAVTFTPAGAILMAGQTLSTGSALSTPNAHQTSFNGDDNSASSAFYDGFVVKFSGPSASPGSYTFTGNGNWSNAANWQGGSPPPSDIPTGVTIIISPNGTDECVIDIPVRLNQGAALQIAPGKRVRILSNLIFL